MNYYSQNKQFCGDEVERACGPVALANSLLLLNQDSSQVPCSQASLPTPGQIIFAVSNPPMKDKPLPGPRLEPWDLTHLAQALLPWPGRAVNRMAHDPMVFCPGDLVYVDRVRLLNCQGKTQYEEAKTSAQIVTVESTSPEGLTVINPGSRIWGRGFRRDMCGSMFHSRASAPECHALHPCRRNGTPWERRPHPPKLSLRRQRRAATGTRQAATAAAHLGGLGNGWNLRQAPESDLQMHVLLALWTTLHVHAVVPVLHGRPRYP